MIKKITRSDVRDTCLFTTAFILILTLLMITAHATGNSTTTTTTSTQPPPQQDPTFLGFTILQWALLSIGLISAIAATGAFFFGRFSKGRGH